MDFDYMRKINKFMGKNSNEKGQVLRDDIGWEALAKYVKEKSPSKIFIITDENTNKLLGLISEQSAIEALLQMEADEAEFEISNE